MKKLLLSSLLCLASLALWSAPSQAWTFGLIPDHCCPFSHCCGGCDKCCSTFCVRPYNAFSPVCSGSITCDGCLPICNSGCGNPGYGFPGCGFPGCGGPGCCPGGALNFQGVPACGGCACDPCTPPAGPVPGPGAQAAPYQGPVQSASYQTPAVGYAPAYYPASVMPPMGSQPWYWSPGGYGR